MSAERHSELVDWFKKGVGTEKCTVEIKGNKEKGDGFVADVIFGKVTLDEPNHNKKEIELIAKVSKNAPLMRQMSEDFCKREIVFYNDIVPIFEQFQKEKKLKEPFDALPKCYKAFVTENSEVIILENMVSRGYELHDRTVPMNINHIKLALKNYAKFHAISLTLSDQKPNIFKQIEEKCFNLLPGKLPMFAEMYEQGKNKVIKNLKETGRIDLAERYEKMTKRSITDLLIDIFNDVPNEKVVTHADCHNGNFLFEYKGGNKENPTNMVMLDFQISFVFSPIIDLSLYLYAGASKEELQHFTELMEFYHKELSSSLSQLGSDVNKLFPISTMWQHWKKYSFYGFNMVTMFLELLFVEKENAPEFTENDKNFDNMMTIKLGDRSKFLERLVGIVEHYLNLNNIN